MCTSNLTHAMYVRRLLHWRSREEFKKGHNWSLLFCAYYIKDTAFLLTWNEAFLLPANQSLTHTKVIHQKHTKKNLSTHSNCDSQESRSFYFQRRRQVFSLY